MGNGLLIKYVDDLWFYVYVCDCLVVDVKI